MQTTTFGWMTRIAFGGRLSRPTRVTPRWIAEWAKDERGTNNTNDLTGLSIIQTTAGAFFIFCKHECRTYYGRFVARVPFPAHWFGTFAIWAVMGSWVLQHEFGWDLYLSTLKKYRIAKFHFNSETLKKFFAHYGTFQWVEGHDLANWRHSGSIIREKLLFSLLNLHSSNRTRIKRRVQRLSDMYDVRTLGSRRLDDHPLHVYRRFKRPCVCVAATIFCFHLEPLGAHCSELLRAAFQLFQ